MPESIMSERESALSANWNTVLYAYIPQDAPFFLQPLLVSSYLYPGIRGDPVPRSSAAR